MLPAVGGGGGGGGGGGVLGRGRGRTRSLTPSATDTCSPPTNLGRGGREGVGRGFERARRRERVWIPVVGQFLSKH